MSPILLSNTSISFKFGKHKRENAKTNIGSPQGDGISGIFLNIALENVLQTLRVDLNEKPRRKDQAYQQKLFIPTLVIS